MAIDAIAAVGLPDLLAGLGIGGGEAAAAGAGAAGAAGAGEAAGLAGAGEGLFGGTTGLLGTDIAAGGAGDLAALTATPGLSTLGTAADFLAAPGAIGAGLGAAGGFGPAADAALGQAAQSGLASGVQGVNTVGGSIADLVPGGGPPAFQPTGATQPTAAGGTSAFGPTPNVSSTAPTATIPGGGPGASAVAPPPGVTTVPDPTAAATAAATNPGAVAGAAAPAAGQSSIQQLLGKLSPTNLASGAIDSLAKNPLGIAAGLGGLGYSIYSGSKGTANEQALKNTALQSSGNAQQLNSEGQQLTSYLMSGTLPPQFQAQITQAVNDAITKAKSDAAAQGLSTDPTQNTALQTKIEQIQNQVPILTSQLETQLAQTGGNLIAAGANQSGLSSNIYQALVQNDTTQAKNAGSAIAALAAAFAGKGQGNIGGTTVTVG